MSATGNKTGSEPRTGRNPSSENEPQNVSNPRGKSESSQRRNPNGSSAAEKAAAKFLLPVVKATDGKYGAQVRLAEMLGKRLGKRLSRHAMNRWLHDDTERQSQPPLGVGLLLRDTFDRYREMILAPWDATKRRRPRRTKAEIEADRKKQQEEENENE